MKTSPVLPCPAAPRSPAVALSPALSPHAHGWGLQPLLELSVGAGREPLASGVPRVLSQVSSGAGAPRDVSRVVLFSATGPGSILLGRGRWPPQLPTPCASRRCAAPWRSGGVRGEAPESMEKAGADGNLGGKGAKAQWRCHKPRSQRGGSAHVSQQTALTCKPSPPQARTETLLLTFQNCVALMVGAECVCVCVCPCVCVPTLPH